MKGNPPFTHRVELDPWLARTNTGQWQDEFVLAEVVAPQGDAPENSDL